MSKQPTTAREVLVTVNEVHADSLPWSFRHCSKDDALDDARDIAEFLKDVAYLMLGDSGDTPFNAKGLRGLIAVHHLLLDKIDIGIGAYKFPVLQHGDDVAALVERGVRE